MLWVVPAAVGGTWRTPKGDLVLTQKFQTFTGTFGKEAVEGRLRGETMTFSAGGITYTGRVNGARMTFSSTVDGKPVEFTGTALPALSR